MSTKPRVAVPTAEVLAEIEIPGIEGIHGVTFDGTHVWFAAQLGAERNDLFCLDPATGKVLRQLGRSDCGNGTAWDGKFLWQGCGDRIHQIDPKTGATVHSIPSPAPGDTSGIAWGAGHLWVGSWEGRRIHKVDCKTGAVVKTLPCERLVTGVTWAGAELWHATYPESEDARESSELHQVDATTGAVRRRVRMPQGMRVSGTEWDGKDRIWCGGCMNSRTLRVVRKPG
jgi:outer membrane protein assembly factor BamB